MAGIAHYNVVEHFYFEKLPGSYQIACNPNVSFRRCCVSARVIVREHEGVGRGHNGQPEYFTRRNKNGVHRADADKVMTFDAAARIEHERNETFTFGGKIRMRRDVQPPIIGRFLWRVVQLQTLRRSTFPQRRHLVFVRLRWKREGLYNLKARKQWGLFVHGVLGGVHVGGKIAAVFPARVLVAGRRNRAARVLPELAAVVPMKPEFREGGGNLFRLPVVKLNPNPPANHFRQFPKFRRFPSNQSQQRFGSQSAVSMPAGEVNGWQFVPNALCGPVLEL
jgi:hypothetical protein